MKGITLKTDGFILKLFESRIEVYKGPAKLGEHKINENVSFQKNIKSVLKNY